MGSLSANGRWVGNQLLVERFGWNGLRRAYAKSMISGGHTKDVVRKKLGDSRGSNTLEKYYYNLEHSEVLGQEFVVDYD